MVRSIAIRVYLLTSWWKHLADKVLGDHTMKTLFFSLSLLILLTGSVYASSKALVTWSNPENYSDLRSSNGGEEEFMAATLNELEQSIQTMASSLPDGQKLEMTITDVDLAGDVKLTGARAQHQDVRVVKDIYPAKIVFSYRLLDQSGNVLKQGDEKLRSRSTSASSMRTGSKGPLEIEKRMLKSWFKRTIAK